jgi:hypothetical protein
MSNKNEDLNLGGPRFGADEAAPLAKEMSRREAVQLLSVTTPGDSLQTELQSRRSSSRGLNFEPSGSSPT